MRWVKNAAFHSNIDATNEASRARGPCPSLVCSPKPPAPCPPELRHRVVQHSAARPHRGPAPAYLSAVWTARGCVSVAAATSCVQPCVAGGPSHGPRSRPCPMLAPAASHRASRPSPRASPASHPSLARRTRKEPPKRWLLECSSTSISPPCLGRMGR